MTLTDEQARHAYVEATNAIAETFKQTVRQLQEKRDLRIEAVSADYNDAYSAAYERRKNDLASAEAKLNEVIEANRKQ